MFTLLIVDSTAEARNAIVDKIARYQREIVAQTTVPPQVSLKPVSPQELRFCAQPHICIVGEECLVNDLTQIATFRKLLPDAGLLVLVGQKLDQLSTIEHIARLGADDVLSENTNAHEFFKKVILLVRKAEKPKSGKLIVVDGGKGGCGVTSIAAATAEYCIDRGARTAVLDFDFETQDLSRFLQTRPFVNENLSALLFDQHPIVRETVEQCLIQVWADEPLLFCMPPPPESTELYAPSSQFMRAIISLLEVVDELFDYVIIDIGATRGLLRNSLYKIADHILFVINNDPATIFASVDKISKVLSILGSANNVTLVENAPTKLGLPRALLRSEINKALAMNNEKSWLISEIPYCKEGMRWPASGATLYGRGSQNLVKSFQEIGARIGISPQTEGAMEKKISILPTFLKSYTKKDQKKLPPPVTSRLQPIVEISNEFKNHSESEAMNASPTDKALLLKRKAQALITPTQIQ